MTAFELHLEVEQKLQEQGSYQRDRIFPEVIDMALRQAEEQFIRENVDVAFADRESRLRNVQPLLEKNRVQVAFIPQSADIDYEADAVYFEIPPDLLYLVKARAEVTTMADCTEPSLATSTHTDYITTVEFPDSTLASSPYYTGFKLVRSGGSVIYTIPTAFTERFQSPDQKYEIIQNVLDTINRPGSTRRVYWESFGSTYAASSFIFVNSTNDTNITLTSYESDGTTPDISEVGVTAARTHTKYNRNLLSSLASHTTSIVPIKEVEPDVLYKMLNLNNFTKSKAKEPLGVKSAFNFYGYEGEGFIITNYYTDYIRKPRQISLVLNQSSELDPSLHRDIVERAVEILKKNIKDPSLQIDTQYNNLRNRNQ